MNSVFARSFSYGRTLDGDLYPMEEEMRVRWLWMMLFAALSAAPQCCLAGEFAGWLERVDLESVTLRDSDNKPVVVRVERNHRFQAAPFLGKWVTVDFQTEKGEFRALGFRSCR